jgi:hypothetical protein
MEGIMCKHLGEIADPVTGKCLEQSFCAKNWEKTKFYKNAKEYEEFKHRPADEFDPKAPVGLSHELRIRLNELCKSSLEMHLLRSSVHNSFYGVSEFDVEKSSASAATKGVILDTIKEINEKRSFALKCIDEEISRIDMYTREIQNRCNHRFMPMRRAFEGISAKRCIYCCLPLVEWSKDIGVNGK